MFVVVSWLCRVLVPSMSSPVFTSKTGLGESQVLKTRGKFQSKEESLLEDDKGREHFNKLDIHVYVGPDEMHRRVLRYLDRDTLICL